jgi:hypothetical protein
VEGLFNIVSLVLVRKENVAKEADGLPRTRGPQPGASDSWTIVTEVEVLCISMLVPPRGYD